MGISVNLLRSKSALQKPFLRRRTAPQEPVTPPRVRKASPAGCTPRLARSTPRVARSTLRSVPRGKFLAFVAKKRQHSVGRKAPDQACPPPAPVEGRAPGEGTPQCAQGTSSQFIMNRRAQTPQKRHLKKATLVAPDLPSRRVKGKQRQGQPAEPPQPQMAVVKAPQVGKPKVKAKAKAEEAQVVPSEWVGERRLLSLVVPCIACLKDAI